MRKQLSACKFHKSEIRTHVYLGWIYHPIHNEKLEELLDEEYGTLLWDPRVLDLNIMLTYINVVDQSIWHGMGLLFYERHGMDLLRQGNSRAPLSTGSTTCYWLHCWSTVDQEKWQMARVCMLYQEIKPIEIWIERGEWHNIMENPTKLQLDGTKITIVRPERKLASRCRAVRVN